MKRSFLFRCLFIFGAICLLFCVAENAFPPSFSNHIREIQDRPPVSFWILVHAEETAPSALNEENSHSPKTPSVNEPVSLPPEVSQLPSSSTPPSVVSSKPRVKPRKVVSNVSSSSVSDSIPVSSTLELPEISEDSLMFGATLSSSAESASGGLIAGLIAWACIGIGLLIILIVLLSTKNSNRNFSRRKQRFSGGRFSKKGRLLPDKYYRNLRKRP